MPEGHWVPRRDTQRLVSDDADLTYVSDAADAAYTLLVILCIPGALSPEPAQGGRGTALPDTQESSVLAACR